MYQIKVHAGLHDGACIPLTNEPISIGFRANADLNLLEGFKPFKVTVTPALSINGITIQVDQGDAALCTDNGQPLESVTVQISSTDQLTLPIFILSDSTIVSISHSNQALDLVPVCVIEAWESYKKNINLPSKPSGSSISNNPLTNSEPIRIKESGFFQSKPVIFLGFAICFCLLAVFGLLIPTEGHTTAPIKSADTLRIVQPDAMISQKKEMLNSPMMTQDMLWAEARRWVNERIEQSGLTDKVKTSFDGGEFIFKAELLKQERFVFEGVVADLAKKYGEHIRISAKISSADPVLPFQIRELSSDPNGWIVTDTGEKIFKGGVYKGYRLVSVQKDKASFQGPVYIDVEW